MKPVLALHAVLEERKKVLGAVAVCLVHALAAILRQGALFDTRHVEERCVRLARHKVGPRRLLRAHGRAKRFDD